MLVTVTCPANTSSTVTANGSARRSRACRRRSRTSARKRARRRGVPGRHGRLPRAQPLGVAAAHLVPGPRVADASGRSPTRPARSSHAPRRCSGRALLSGRSRRSARPRARAAASSTARPSFTPPREPGQVHHERLAADARPARATAPRSGRPCRRRTPGSPRRCRAPRGRAAARVTSGVRSVGVRPVPPVVSTTRAPASTAAADRVGRPARRRVRRPGRSPRSPARSAPRRSAGRWCPRRRRRRRGWTRTRRRSRGVTDAVTSRPRLAAGLGLDPDVGDDGAPCRRP